LTDAPIPWPYVQRLGDKRSLIVCGSLEQAIRTESVSAVARHWGVSRWTVQRWRAAIGVERFNEGTLASWSRLKETRIGEGYKIGRGRR
jgi:transposase-like protein